jgi:hypothetical protein
LPGIELAREQGIAIEGPNRPTAYSILLCRGHGMPCCRRIMTRAYRHQNGGLPPHHFYHQRHACPANFR